MKLTMVGGEFRWGVGKKKGIREKVTAPSADAVAVAVAVAGAGDAVGTGAGADADVGDADYVRRLVFWDRGGA